MRSEEVRFVTTAGNRRRRIRKAENLPRVGSSRLRFPDTMYYCAKLDSSCEWWQWGFGIATWGREKEEGGILLTLLLLLLISPPLPERQGGKTSSCSRRGGRGRRRKTSSSLELLFSPPSSSQAATAPTPPPSLLPCCLVYTYCACLFGGWGNAFPSPPPSTTKRKGCLLALS